MLHLHYCSLSIFCLVPVPQIVSLEIDTQGRPNLLSNCLTTVQRMKKTAEGFTERTNEIFININFGRNTTQQMKVSTLSDQKSKLPIKFKSPYYKKSILSMA